MEYKVEKRHFLKNICTPNLPPLLIFREFKFFFIAYVFEKFFYFTCILWKICYYLKEHFQEGKIFLVKKKYSFTIIFGL